MKHIRPYKTRLSAGNAYWMARLSSQVYTKVSGGTAPDEAAILQNLQNEDPGFKSVHGEDRNSAQGILAEHRDYFAFAFRGTDEGADWFDNLEVKRTDSEMGVFHQGFYNSFKDLWEPLFSRYLELFKRDRRPVFFTGHSLGGAIATVAASAFVMEDRPFTSAYTFGQPRALERETADRFDSRVGGQFYRFQNNNDIVTRIPARIMGYSHVGRTLYISQEKVIHTDPGWWFRFLDTVDGAVEAVKEQGIDLIVDHSMDKYLEAVELWLVYGE